MVRPKLDAFAERASRKLLATRETARRRTVEIGAGPPAVRLSTVTPTVGQLAMVIGPTIITTAPTSFINVDNQVSPVGNVSGGQAARPMTEAG